MFINCAYINIEQYRHRLLRQPQSFVLIKHFNAFFFILYLKNKKFSRTIAYLQFLASVITFFHIHLEHLFLLSETNRIQNEDIENHEYILAKEENQVDFQEINISAIEGFHYEKGYEYELLVEKKTLVNTNFDNNQTKYKLIELISKNKVDFKYLIITKENPFILHSAGGRFEIPLQCIKEKYINNKLSEKEHHPLKGLKYKIGTNYGGITNIVKEGKEIGFYKIIIERYGAYNMNGIPEWFCAFYTKNANLNFDLKPSPIYEQIFEQPQTKGEQYLILPIINISIGTFDI